MARKEFAALIPAAGESSRMGQPKLALPFDHKQTFVERCVSAYLDFGCIAITIVAQQESLPWLQRKRRHWPAYVSIAVNNHPEKGRFHSVQLGLRQIPAKTPVFLHNVDNPFVSQETLEALVRHIDEADYVRPVFQDQMGHPVLVAPHVAEALAKESNAKSSVRSFLGAFRHVNVPVDRSEVLVNINTPEDYRRYFL